MATVETILGDHPGEGNPQRSVVAYAERHHAAIQMSRMTEDDLRLLRDQKCDALIVASYKWKIPDWEPYLKYAVNFHPSLPGNEGPRPAVHAIFQKRGAWAVTCHRVTHAWTKAPFWRPKYSACSPTNARNAWTSKSRWPRSNWRAGSLDRS